MGATYKKPFASSSSINDLHNKGQSLRIRAFARGEDDLHMYDGACKCLDDNKKMPIQQKVFSEEGKRMNELILTSNHKFLILAVVDVSLPSHDQDIHYYRVDYTLTNSLWFTPVNVTDDNIIQLNERDGDDDDSTSDKHFLMEYHDVSVGSAQAYCWFKPLIPRYVSDLPSPVAFFDTELNNARHFVDVATGFLLSNLSKDEFSWYSPSRFCWHFCYCFSSQRNFESECSIQIPSAGLSSTMSR